MSLYYSMDNMKKIKETGKLNYFPKPFPSFHNVVSLFSFVANGKNNFTPDLQYFFLFTFQRSIPPEAKSSLLAFVVVRKVSNNAFHVIMILVSYENDTLHQGWE